MRFDDLFANSGTKTIWDYREQPVATVMTLAKRALHRVVARVSTGKVAIRALQEDADTSAGGMHECVVIETRH